MHYTHKHKVTRLGFYITRISGSAAYTQLLDYHSNLMRTGQSWWVKFFGSDKSNIFKQLPIRTTKLLGAHISEDLKWKEHLLSNEY